VTPALTPAPAWQVRCERRNDVRRNPNGYTNPNVCGNFHGNSYGNTYTPPHNIIPPRPPPRYDTPPPPPCSLEPLALSR